AQFATWRGTEWRLPLVSACLEARWLPESSSRTTPVVPGKALSHVCAAYPVATSAAVHSPVSWVVARRSTDTADVALCPAESVDRRTVPAVSSTIAVILPAHHLALAPRYRIAIAKENALLHPPSRRTPPR